MSAQHTEARALLARSIVRGVLDATAQNTLAALEQAVRKALADGDTNAANAALEELQMASQEFAEAGAGEAVSYTLETFAGSAA